METNVTEGQYRSLQTHKMEQIMGRLNDPETGIIFTSESDVSTGQNSTFTGATLVKWLHKELNCADEQEAMHVGDLLITYGYIYALKDFRGSALKLEKNLVYRFQVSKPDVTDYAIYLVKQEIGRRKHQLEDYEQMAVEQLKKTLSDKWECIHIQATEQLRSDRKRNKMDRAVVRSMERAFWRVHKPSPTQKFRILESPPRHFTLQQMQARRKHLLTQMSSHCSRDTKEETISHSENDDDPVEPVTLDDTQMVTRGQEKKSLDSLILYAANHKEFDWAVSQDISDNPWLAASNEASAWTTDCPEAPADGTVAPAPYPSLKQVRMWGTHMDHLLRDPHGCKWFEYFMQKEYSCENMRFWLAVCNYKFGPLSKITEEAFRIYDEFLSSSATSEINVDSVTMSVTEKLMKEPTHFIFDAAAEHIYNMVRVDSYTRFLRSAEYAKLVKVATDHHNSKTPNTDANT